MKWGYRLWFDVERRYLTTELNLPYNVEELWFDVERRYLTTKRRNSAA